MRALAAGVVLVAVAASASGATPKPALRPTADATDVPGSPLDLTSVTFGEPRARMVMRIVTAGDWSPRQLAAGAGRSVCIKLFNDQALTARAQVCVVGDAGASRVRYSRLHKDGRPYADHVIKAAVSRDSAHSLLATFEPAAAELRPGPYSWQAETAWTDSAACAPPRLCVDRAPDSATVPARIARPPRMKVTGCVPRGPTQRRSGSGGSRSVALTFDDGPGQSTPAVLRVLEREHIPGTFFLVGSNVAGHGSLLRRMLRDGSMIGNHTLTHANVGGGGASAVHQIATTQAIIKRASGFTPCLFRPPYGATSGALSGVVRSLDALSILWNVDPQDWRTPGTGAIVATVERQTRTGSIILLHDGGGPRSQTVAALPTIIHDLRRRNLRFVTVTQLLHLRLRERSAG